MNRATVAVTGLDARENPYPGLAIARCLRAAPGFNGKIIALTYDSFTTGIYRDDIFDAVYIIPYPSEPEKKLRNRLLEIHREYPFDVIIPALDTEISIYARMADFLRASGVHTLLPPEGIVKSRNKDNLAGTCRRLGIRTPRTVVVTHLEQLDEEIPGLKFPMVIKGSIVDAHIIQNREEMKVYYMKILEKWGFPVLLQERLVGEEFDIAAVADRNHRVVSQIAIRKFAISERGKASAGIVIDDPQMKQIAEKVLERMQWVGPCELELLRENATGRFFLLEINARFPAWIYLSVEAACNLPFIDLELALGKTITDPPEAKPGSLFFRNRFGNVVDISLMGSLLSESRWIQPASGIERV